MTSQGKLGQGAVYLGISTLVFMGSGYLINIGLGRYLGPGLYGIYGVLTSLMTAMNIMQVNGLPQALSKFVAEDEAAADRVLASAFSLQLGLTLAAGAVFALLAPALAMVFHTPAFVGYGRAMAVVFPAYGLFALYGGYYNGRHDFKRQAAMNIIYSATKLILVVALAVVFSLYGVIAGFTLAALVGLALGWRWPRSPAGAAFPVRRLVGFALPLIGFAFVSTLQLSVDLFCVKALAPGAAAAGFYTAAQNIALIAFVGLSALGQVMFPNMSRLLGSRDVAGARRVASESVRWLWLLLLPLVALMVGTAPALVHLLYGSAYGPAAPALRLLAIGYIPLTLFGLVGTILNGAGYARISVRWAIVGLVAQILGCLVAIPQWGLVGAALATMVGATVAAAGGVGAASERLGLAWQKQTLFKATVGAVIIGLGGYLLPAGGWWLVVDWSLLGLVYGAWLVVVRELTVADLGYLRSIAAVRG